jgi:hypothetical protein
MSVAKIQTQQPVQDVVTMAETETLKVVEAASPKEVAQVEQAIAEVQQPPLVPNKILMNLFSITICIRIAIIEPEVKFLVKTEIREKMVPFPVVDPGKGLVKKKIPSTIRPSVFSKRRVTVSYKIQIVSKWHLN